MSAPALGSNLFSRGTGTSRSVDVSSVADGSWMIASVFQGDSSTVTLTPPAAGWALLVPRQPIGTRSFTIWGRVKQAGDSTMTWTTSASVTISLVVAYGAGPCRAVSEWVIGLAGVRNAGNVISGQSVQAGTDSTTVAPSITVPDETRVITVSLEATSAAESNISSVSGATAWLYINPTNVTESTFLASVEVTTGAATSAVTTTYVNTQASNAGAVQIGIPAPAADPPVEGDAVGTFMFGGTATGVIEPVPGFANIDQVLHTPGVTWAHRGGSANWPEMTDYAYTRAAAHGYGVLEFSCGRSSDGWWFGLHDANLDRTSGLTGSPNVSTMTQAEIEAYQVTLNAGGNPQPYYGLVDFLQKWTDTHVVVIDPKNALSYSSELLDLIELHVPDAQDRVVMKFYGVGGGALAFADLCRARGFTTWGYFYQADYDAGDLDANHARWDWLGMNLAATTGWTGGTYPAVTSYGQPVAAHIIQSQGEYDSAIVKGARMVQVGNVAAVQRVGVESVIPDGDASGAYGFGGTAMGYTLPTATGIGTFEYGGTAAGQRASEATASGAWSLGGTAAGSRASEGAAVGGWAVAGSASSSSTPEGVAVGTFTFTATAEGSTVTSGGAAGAVNFGGAAAGSIVATGTAAGAYAFAGSATSAQPVTFPSIRTLTSAAPARTITGAAAGRTLDGTTLDRTLIGAVP